MYLFFHIVQNWHVSCLLIDEGHVSGPLINDWLVSARSKRGGGKGPERKGDAAPLRAAVVALI